MNKGFTIIEVIVTIVIGVLLLLGILQVTILSTGISASESYFTTASNLAYSNLRQFANGGPPSWFLCQDLNDGWGYSKQELYSTSSVSGLPDPVTQSVVATPVRSCTSYSSTPIQVVSTVTYGPTSQVVTHVSYAGY